MLHVLHFNKNLSLTWMISLPTSFYILSLLHSTVEIPILADISIECMSPRQNLNLYIIEGSENRVEYPSSRGKARNIGDRFS